LKPDITLQASTQSAQTGLHCEVLSIENILPYSRGFAEHPSSSVYLVLLSTNKTAIRLEFYFIGIHQVMATASCVSTIRHVNSEASNKHTTGLLEIHLREVFCTHQRQLTVKRGM
jgi:hypothetical protein